MRLTKWGHACVGLEKDGRVLVIDPGVFTEPEALEGVDAILVTHEHVDHFDEGRLRAALDADPALRVWTVRSVADRLTGYGERVSAVGDGDTFSAAGFEVEAHGELHAEIHPTIPRIANTGFVLDGSVFHPGDALTLPGRAVETLLLPLHAPWSKLSEVADYAAEVKARRSFALHDGLLQDAGLAVYGRLVGTVAPDAHYSRLAPGEAVDLD